MLQVPGNPMGPAVAHRGAIDQCLRNLYGGGGAIGACTRAGSSGTGTGGTGGGTGGSGMAYTVDTKGFLDDCTDFRYSDSSIGGRGCWRRRGRGEGKGSVVLGGELGSAKKDPISSLMIC